MLVEGCISVLCVYGDKFVHIANNIHQALFCGSHWLSGMKTLPNLCPSGFDCFPGHVKLQACAILSAALTATNSRGLVVGHTPQTIGANWYDLFYCFFDTLFLLAFIMTSIPCSGSMSTVSNFKDCPIDHLTELQKTHEIRANIKFYQILPGLLCMSLFSRREE
jgi:hypothetical protein